MIYCLNLAESALVKRESPHVKDGVPTGICTTRRYQYVMPRIHYVRQKLESLGYIVEGKVSLEVVFPADQLTIAFRLSQSDEILGTGVWEFHGTGGCLHVRITDTGGRNESNWIKSKESYDRYLSSLS